MKAASIKNFALVWKKIISTLRHKVQKLFIFKKAVGKNILYRFLFSKILIKSYIVLASRKFKENSFGIVSVLYFLTLLFLGHFIHISNADAYIQDKGDVLFTAVGAMLGVVVSIVFSFSSTLMENVSKELPAGFYELLSKSKLQNFILWINLFIIAIFFFLAAVSKNDFPPCVSAEAVLKISIIISCLVLWGLSFSFHNLRQKFGKYTIITILEKICLNELKKTHKNFSELALLQSRHPKETGKLKIEHYIASIYSRSGYNQNLIQIIDNLFDYHDKLIASEDKGPARVVLTAIYRLLYSYVKMREESSLAFPSGFFSVRVSDSQELLGFGLENFMARGLAYVKMDNTQGIIHVVDILKSLCIHSINVKVVNNPGYDNPIFSQCFGYFGQFIDNVSKEKSIEGMLQTARALSEIAKAFPYDRSTSEIYSITDKLKKLAVTALQNNYGIIVQEVIAAYNLLISSQLLNLKTQIDVDLDKCFQDLLQLINYQAAIGPSSDMHQELQYAYLFSSIDQAVHFHIELLTKSENDEKTKQSIKHRLSEILEKYYRFIYDIATAKIQADFPLYANIAKSIENIASVLLDNLKQNIWSYDKPSIISYISKYSHLPGWFLAKREKNQKQLDAEFTEVLTKIGLLALSEQEDEITNQCFSTLERNFNAKINASDLRGALDVLEKMSFLALFANKLKNQLGHAFSEKIKSLDRILLEKASEGVPDDIKKEHITASLSLLNRMIAFYQESGRRRDNFLLDTSSETYLMSYIELNDVALFINLIWGFDVSKVITHSLF